jgi:hypothetical protein
MIRHLQSASISILGWWAKPQKGLKPLTLFCIRIIARKICIVAKVDEGPSNVGSIGCDRTSRFISECMSLQNYSNIYYIPGSKSEMLGSMVVKLTSPVLYLALVPFHSQFMHHTPLYGWWRQSRFGNLGIGVS